MAMLNVRNSSQ